MATTKPKVGATYRFLGVIGDGDERTPLGADANALVPGEVVTVRELVDAGEIGAYDDSADSVVIEWTMPSLVRTEDGWGHGEASRAISVSVADFGTNFEEA